MSKVESHGDKNADGEMKSGNQLGECSVDSSVAASSEGLRESPVVDRPTGTSEDTRVVANHIEPVVDDVAEPGGLGDHPFWLLLKQAWYEEW